MPVMRSNVMRRMTSCAIKPLIPEKVPPDFIKIEKRDTPMIRRPSAACVMKTQEPLALNERIKMIVKKASGPQHT